MPEEALTPADSLNSDGYDLPAVVWTIDRELAIRSFFVFGSDGAAGGDAPGKISLYECLRGEHGNGAAVTAQRRALEGASVAFAIAQGDRRLRAFVQPMTNAQGTVGAAGCAFEATARARAAELLQRSEETLTLAQAAAHLGYWSRDFITGDVFCSTELCALFGIPPASRPTPEVLWRHIHPEDRLALEAAMDVACEERRTFVLDTRLIRADGGERWVHHRGKITYAGDRPIRAVGTVLDITVRKRAEERSARHARYDDLTNLPSRELLVDRLQQTLLRAEERASPMAVLYVDFDRFKVINGTLGHAVGDQFLRMVAPRLVAAVPEADPEGVGRVGGDEFVVVLPSIDSAGDAASVAERIVAAFAKPVALEGRELYSSARVGISIYPDDGTTPEELIRSADAALARADRAHPGTRFYAPATRERAIDRLELEDELHRAFAKSEFALHYQPIVDRYERPVALEALLRWEVRDRGTIEPERFIPLCEETGLIVPLGRWVITHAIAQVARWQREGLGPLRLALNISGRQVHDPELETTLAGALREHGLDANFVELEITESVVMADVAGWRRLIASLKRLGVRIALDDFGTGYSALSHLKHFDVDALKIDRTFVRDLPFDRGDAAIISAIVALGRSMGLGVVAEGIETAEQAELLRQLGCDEMQGYYFAKPMPPRILERALRGWSVARTH